MRRKTAALTPSPRALSALPIVTALLLSASASSAAENAALPKGRAGECFQQKRLHGVYRVDRQETPQPPLVTTRTIPAVTERRQERVVAVPEHVVWREVPAQYATVPKVVEVAGPPRWIRTPAVYKVVSERVIATPAHLEWRRSVSAAGFGGDAAPGEVVARPTGEVICRVLVPARYAWTQRRVVVVPAGTREVPGRKRKIICYVKVVSKPAHKVAITVPATYKTIEKTVIVHPARTETVTTPRPPKIHLTRTLVTPGKTVWSKIGCREAAALRGRDAAPTPAAPSGATTPAAPQPSQGAKP